MENAQYNAPTQTKEWMTEQFNHVGLSFETTQTLYMEKSDFQQVKVVDTIAYGRMLLLDGCVMTTDRDEFVYHEMITHIPMLASPVSPKSVLVIGGGDGGTVREVLKHPTVEEVVLCEIDGLVIETCQKFFPAIAGKLTDPRVDIQVRDGIEYVRQLPENRFDVILVDSSDPQGVSEVLFTEEFYGNAARALKPQGVLAAQTGAPIFMKDEFVATVKRLKGIFPVARPYLATIPTYPGQLWSWTYCAKEVPPLKTVSEEKAAAIANQTQYYNWEIHQAAFALPNNIKALLPELAMSPD